MGASAPTESVPGGRGAAGGSVLRRASAKAGGFAAKSFNLTEGRETGTRPWTCLRVADDDARCDPALGRTASPRRREFIGGWDVKGVLQTEVGRLDLGAGEELGAGAG
jgi:hypothetical protein